MKLDFHKKARDYVKAMGAGGTIKKQNCAPLELKLPKPPELGKLETHATFPLLDRITALSPGKQMTNSLMHAG